jgi:hypothetical protein
VTGPALPRPEMLRLLRLLEGELARAGVVGELHLVGGAVMCLVLGARESTRDMDGLFRPARTVREAAARLALAEGLPERWLNDAVKGFLGPRNEFEPFLDLPHLRVMVASPRYLLAMKCVAMRLGPEFHDLEDVRYLLRHLDIRTAAEAMAIVRDYFDEASIPPRAALALEELLAG